MHGASHRGPSARFSLGRRPSDRLPDGRSGPLDGQGARVTQSKGKLGVKVFPNGALGSERDTIEQLKIGGLDMMRINAAPLNNIVPETIAVSLPFVFRSTEHMRKVLDGPIGDEILAAMDAQGMVGLAFYDSGARSFYTAKKPVKTLADMKGHEDPRAAVRSLRRDDRSARRQPDADALRRGLHRPQDRHRRRRREQLAVVRVVAPLRGGQVLRRSPSIRWCPRCWCSRRRSGTRSPRKTRR